MVSFKEKEVSIEIYFKIEHIIDSIIIRGETGNENKGLSINDKDNIVKLIALRNIKDNKSYQEILDMFNGMKYEEVKKYLIDNEIIYSDTAFM